jgi:hypothetical protein
MTNKKMGMGHIPIKLMKAYTYHQPEVQHASSDSGSNLKSISTWDVR